MDKKTRIEYFSKTKSDRILEKGELLSLITSSRSGISKKSLQNFTGNLLRNDFNTLIKNNLVRRKQTTALSKRLENLYSTSKKMNIEAIKELELLSYAVWYMRTLNIRIGQVTITSNRNILANAALNEDNYVQLEFIPLSLQNFEQKLSKIKNNNSVQTILVIEDTTIARRIKPNQIANKILITKINTEPATLIAKINGNYLEENHAFCNINQTRDKLEVEKILNGYRKCEQLREKSLKNTERSDGKWIKKK